MQKSFLSVDLKRALISTAVFSAILISLPYMVKISLSEGPCELRESDGRVEEQGGSLYHSAFSSISIVGANGLRKRKHIVKWRGRSKLGNELCGRYSQVRWTVGLQD
ncbi:hypothetical protein PISMIDRAFT_688952 [Pisolithus microcarpus 441]|uniref:Uncharacterized protein n=1 Tax=Pisolithus microcarpus 441 TaxID=765257 RepID=A0A0C9YGY1_9AGAM|nr:hypothetical protein PISMIDRAFT_688952 [Pisolithus microcarpus 441]